MSVLHDCVTKKCRTCGKEFGVLHPDRWAYKWKHSPSNITWFCSWRCLRETEKEEEQVEPIARAHRITPEEKAEAVRRAIEDGSPYEYLNGLGIKAPYSTWKHLKQHLKDHDPETYAKLPERFRGGNGGRAKKVETPEAVAMAVETPEAPAVPKRITAPLMYDNLTVRALDGKFGRYTRVITSKGDFIDFEPKQGDITISYTVAEWKDFLFELKKSALVLGVEL